MKTLYFDCSSGISGDMTLAALLDLGIDKEKFVQELNKLNVEGYDIVFSRDVKNGIGANKVDVVITIDGYDEDGHPIMHHIHDDDKHCEHHHEHDHHHPHVHRNLNDVFAIIDNSEISETSKDLAKRIFMRVARAEAKVHNEPLDKVHFHEVGAIDSIVDIIGTAICIDMIKPDKIVASVVNDGYGFIMCQHGQIPVPVPATAQIFAESNVISRQIDIDTELVTPTGAAIIAELAESYGVMPPMNVTKIGYGAGKKVTKIPNILRISMGEFNEEASDEIAVLETNIDDASGEVLGYTMDRLIAAGAKDVFYSPIFMKKNRPAYKLTVLCSEDNAAALEDIIFGETTTIGIRRRYETRSCLERSVDTVETSYGRLDVKKVVRNGKTTVYPEYESAKKLAEVNNVPLKDIYKMS